MNVSPVMGLIQVNWLEPLICACAKRWWCSLFQPHVVTYTHADLPKQIPIKVSQDMTIMAQIMYSEMFMDSAWEDHSSLLPSEWF